MLRAPLMFPARVSVGCVCSSRLFSSSRTSSLPPPLPLHAHENSSKPEPFPSSPDSLSPLALLASQPSHYISALLLGRRYLLTPNDVLTVPKLKGVKPGDVLALTRILEVGSRDYTLRPARPLLSTSAILTPALSRTVVDQSGTIPRDWQRHPDSLPVLEEGVVRAELRVLEHTKGKMFEVTKFKKRKGYRRTLRSKLGFTRLRVGEFVFGTEA